MQKLLKILLLAILFSLANSTLDQSFANNSRVVQPTKAEFIIVDIIDIGRHEMSWSSMTGTGSYFVTVYDMTTSTMHTQLSTTNTSTEIIGLVSGHNYLCMVMRGANTQSANYSY